MNFARRRDGRTDLTFADVRLGSAGLVPEYPLSAPKVGQQVEIEGENHRYTVLHVDHARHLADLLKHGGIQRVVSGIPLVLLRVMDDPQEAEELTTAAD